MTSATQTVQIPEQFAYLTRCTSAQKSLLYRLYGMHSRGDGMSVYGKPFGLQTATRTGARPALVYAGGRSRQGVSLPVSATSAGIELVTWLSLLSPSDVWSLLRVGPFPFSAP